MSQQSIPLGAYAVVVLLVGAGCGWVEEIYGLSCRVMQLVGLQAISRFQNY